VYIGRDRRQGQRRDPQSFVHRELRGQAERRVGADRRQEALAGVIVGMSAEDMALLADFWRSIEEKRDEIRGRA
jgi:hypothetical protein